MGRQGLVAAAVETKRDIEARECGLAVLDPVCAETDDAVGAAQVSPAPLRDSETEATLGRGVELVVGERRIRDQNSVSSLSQASSSPVARARRFACGMDAVPLSALCGLVPEAGVHRQRVHHIAHVIYEVSGGQLWSEFRRRTSNETRARHRRCNLLGLRVDGPVDAPAICTGHRA